MAIGTQFQTMLTPADAKRVLEAQMLLEDCRVGMAQVCETLSRIKGFQEPYDKLNRSCAALAHEKQLLGDRLKTLLEQGKRAGGCDACGCKRSGEACDFCGSRQAA